MALIADIVTTRHTVPDHGDLLVALRAALTSDVTLGPIVDVQQYRVRKDTDWTPAQLATAKATIEAAPAQTVQQVAQRAVDSFPIEYRALVLALIDALNVVRAALPTPLPAITPAQALAAIRTKAGQL